MTEFSETMYLANNVDIDANWLLGAISTLAGTLWVFMMSRLKKQDEIIKSQGETITNMGEVIENYGKTVTHLEADVKRMSRGCGVAECLWKDRC